MAPNWTGPILLRSADYLKGLQHLLDRTQRRVVHNSMLVMFALSILPAGRPDGLVCARSTMWALPEAASALYASQFSDASVRDAITRVCWNILTIHAKILITNNLIHATFATQTEVIFEVLKAWLKRAPSLKGAALVKLSQLRVQIATWPTLTNSTATSHMLDAFTISSDNWFENVLAIFRTRQTAAVSFVDVELMDNNSTA